MRNIGTITFHGAHNFGSVLQTYALQEFIKHLCNSNNIKCNYKVINFRPNIQKEFYSVYKSWTNPKNILKNTIAFKYRNSLNIKHKKFEDFLNTYINLTEEINNSEDVNKFSKSFDYFISGSDQIWNVRAQDFDDVYYLNFVKSGKKISYAVSMGPLDIDWNKYGEQKYRNLINDYDNVSVREIGTAQKVKLLSENEVDMNVDPTFLLQKKDWKKIESDANYNDGKYILLYCLEPSREQLKMAKLISKKLDLPILITKYNNKNDIINGFVKKYDSGPLDFLSYIDNAALVLSSSFHGTAFSMIYNKPFYVFNGTNDNRIFSILKIADIEERSIETIADVDRVKLDRIDYTVINQLIDKEREKSKSYLIKALEI